MATHIIYPQLDGVKIRENRDLPIALIQAIRKSYDYITQISTDITRVDALLDNLVQIGPHASRIAVQPASIPLGSLWMEEDRRFAIYQVQLIAGAPAWRYITGTMWGTLNPDQRPADLGANDGGFDFRTTDANPLYGGREFIWSGSVWIEVTAVRYGTHADRLALNPLNIISSELFVETDRSNVIYQIQSSAWHYVTGTMYGASVASRPTDLGPNDAGFLFFANDTYQLWRWNGTAWVDQTPANDVQYAPATAVLTLSTSVQDVPGATLTLTRPGQYWLHGVFDFNLAGAGDVGAIFVGYLNANGGMQGQQALFMPGNGTGTTVGRATVGQQWIYTAPAASIVVKLQAQKTGGSGTSQAIAPHTTLSALWIHP